ncbi:unnamed protein product, partial [Prorocentrum cordatum]
MKRTKKDVRKEFKEKSREGQREFLQIWKKTGNFNHAECMKTESRSHVDKDDTNSDWFNWDDLCKACGWTPENAKTLVGERALQRALAVKDFCDKSASDNIKTDIQTGDKLYRRVRETSQSSNAHKKEVKTVVHSEKQPLGDP